jgi:phosphoglycolate phosphatase-like HAD superfamily hydrolase
MNDIQAVLFDLDFTLAKPGPDLGPEGYQRLGRRFGLDLDPAKYKEARAKAVEGLRKHPDFRHDKRSGSHLRNGSSGAWAGTRIVPPNSRSK